MNLNEKLIMILSEVKPYEQIDMTTELLDSGILDSMSIILFITLIEDELEIEIPDEEIKRENLGTLEKVLCLVQRQINQ